MTKETVKEEPSEALLVVKTMTIRNYVKVLFMTWGHAAIEFATANKPSPGSIRSKGSHSEPELALMDIRISPPRGNGIARRMRSIAHFHHIPIVLMTAFSLSSDAVHSQARWR